MTSCGVLQREALLGGGELLERLLAGRAAALARLRSTPWLRVLSDATLRQMRTVPRSGAYACALPLRADDLARLMELALPGLADDTVLHHPTHARAAEIIPELPLLRGRADAVRQVLAQSSLDEPTTFRTVDDAHRRPVVHGQDGRRSGRWPGWPTNWATVCTSGPGRCARRAASSPRNGSRTAGRSRSSPRIWRRAAALRSSACGGSGSVGWTRSTFTSSWPSGPNCGPPEGFEALVSPRAGVFRESRSPCPATRWCTRGRRWPGCTPVAPPDPT